MWVAGVFAIALAFDVPEFALEVDVDGDVWIGTHNAGVVRYTPSADRFTYYTEKSGLPSDFIRQIQVDRYGSGPRTVFISKVSL